MRLIRSPVACSSHIEPTSNGSSLFTYDECLITKDRGHISGFSSLKNKHSFFFTRKIVNQTIPSGMLSYFNERSTCTPFKFVTKKAGNIWICRPVNVLITSLTLKSFLYQRGMLKNKCEINVKKLEITQVDVVGPGTTRREKGPFLLHFVYYLPTWPTYK